MDRDFQQTLALDFLSENLSKSQQTQIRIMDGAIRAFVKYGLEKSSYQKIAKHSSCSYALVKHYYPDRHALFGATMRYIRFRFQKLAVEAIQNETDPKAQLLAYVASTFEWIREFRDHAQVWLLFFFMCGSHKRYRQLNSEMVNMGHQRITALLKHGGETGDFSRRADQSTAKTIQVTITGALVAAVTEDIDPNALEKEIQSLCLSIAQNAV